jgi:cobalt-zinc-cadmium efflux system membrane fusion protein
MKTIPIYIYLILVLNAITACNNSEEKPLSEQTNSKKPAAELVLPDAKIKDLGLDIGKIKKQKIYHTVKSNGKLAVPPHNSALITAIVGANMQDIFVLEGEKVKKGQMLALLSHPKLIQMQTDYLKKSEELKFLEAEYNRRKTMYEEKAISGKALLEAETQYRSTLAEVTGLQKQLQQLKIDINKLQKGEILSQIPVLSPIDGFIEKIFVRLGQFVSEQQPMFSVLNNNHLHADLLVYESDAEKVEIGQRVLFHTQSKPEKQYKARIIAVSKSFEEEPKAIHLHADIDDNENAEHLISGMFIEGEIIVDSTENYALNESAVVLENNTPQAFKATKNGNNWHFILTPLSQIFQQDSFYVFKNKPDESLYVRKNAYYIISELNKDEMAE